MLIPKIELVDLKGKSVYAALMHHRMEDLIQKELLVVCICLKFKQIIVLLQRKSVKDNQ